MTGTEIDADIERMLTIHRNRKRYNWDYYDKDHGHRPAEWHPGTPNQRSNAHKRARRLARQGAS